MNPDNYNSSNSSRVPRNIRNSNAGLDANLNTANHPGHARLVEPLLSLSQDGEASRAEQATVESYLATCAECRRVLQQFEMVKNRLTRLQEQILPPRSLPRFAPPASLIRPGVLFSFKGETEPEKGSWESFRKRNRLTPAGFGLLSGIAAVTVIAVSLVLVLLLNQAPQPAALGSLASASPTPTVQPSPTPSPSPLPTATPTLPPPTETPVPASATPGQAEETPAAVETASPSQSLPVLPETTSETRQAASKTVQNTSGILPTSAANVKVSPTQTTPAVTVGPVATSTAPGGSIPNTAAQAGTAVLPGPSLTVTSKTVLTQSPAATETTPILTSSPSVTAQPAATALTAPATISSPIAGLTSAALPTLPLPVSTRPLGDVVNAPGWIAYVGSSDMEVHLTSSDGISNLILTRDSLANNIRWEELVWSHDGRWLAGVAQVNPAGAKAIYWLSVEQRNETKLNFIAEGFAPVWSPDDLSLAYLAGPVRIQNRLLTGKPALLNLKKRGSAFPLILNDEYQTLPPQWFEEGNSVLVGQNHLQTFAIDGTPLSSFDVPFDNTCAAAALSPFGNKLAVLESSTLLIFDLNKGIIDSAKPLFRIPVNTSGKVGFKCGAYRLHWTPSGRSVYYYVNNGNGTTNILAINGGSSTLLPGVFDPSFTSDGAYLTDAGTDGRGLVTAVGFGPRPSNPRIIGQSKSSPVWQPR